MSYNIMTPLTIFGVLAGAILVFVALHYIYVRKVTYTTGELRQKNSYYEPRMWTIVLTVIILILALGFKR